MKKFKIFLSLTITLLLLGSLSHAIATKDKQEGSSALEPTREQKEASLYVARALTLSHYRKQHIDKTLSEKLFENYLDSLDPSRLYFLSSDISEFEIYRFRLDSALKTGQLQPAFKIYNRYQDRVLARLNKQIDFLENKIDSLDFTRDEYILADRSEQPWANSNEELDDIWRRRTKSAVLSQKLDGKTVKEAQESLVKRYKNQLNRTTQIRSEDAFSAYMNAFTTIYDPHTNYFSPQTSENFNINMSLSLEGIGAVLQSENEFTKVVRLVPGGPAKKQGRLGTADRIVGVAQGEDGEMVDVIGWRLDEVVQLIRGPKHSTVRLKVIPSSAKVDTDTTEIKIVRDKVKLEEQAADSSVMEIERQGKIHRIGLIDIPTFYADFKGMQDGDPNYKSTTRDTLKLLKKMQEEAPLDGLVIDLRGNGGGSLDEANQLTGLFIDRGPTVQIRGANNRIEVLEDPDPQLVYDGPLIVLVDRLSASASEIFAGAIQDYGRGIVMGSPTFGKGTVQSVRPLNHGQLKITQAKFYRISGASTQHKGVVPDILLPDTTDKTKVGEDALKNALEWDSIKSAKYKPLDDLQNYNDELSQRHVERISSHPEYKILLEEIALLEEQRNVKKVTINEAKRKAEDEAFDKAQLALVNKRRALDGKKPYKTIEEWLDADKEENAEDEEKPLDPDFIAEESAEVLLDFMTLTRMLTATAA